MDLEAVPAGFSNSAALSLLRTMHTVSSSNERFITTKMSSISAHVSTTLSADAMFSILKTVAASGDRVASGGQALTESAAPQDGSAGDLAWQFGATATATATTTGVQASTAAPAGAVTAQVSVTAASVKVASGSSGPGTTAAWIQAYFQEYVADNAMSSEQISDALYAGGSVGGPALGGAGSFEDVVDGLYGAAQGETAAASRVVDGLAAGRPAEAGTGSAGQTDDQAVGVAAAMDRDADDLDAEASGMTAAFEAHALTFQKASDVAGLDYAETVRGSAFVGRGGIDRSSTLDQGFLDRDADGKRHALFDVGGVEIYASW